MALYVLELWPPGKDAPTQTKPFPHHSHFSTRAKICSIILCAQTIVSLVIATQTCSKLQEHKVKNIGRVG